MSVKTVKSPTSHVRFGVARIDITPPPNIYHPLWGAARHDRATGVHRPLLADILIFIPMDAQPGLVRVELDLPGLVAEQHTALLRAVSEACHVSSESVIISYSHSHAAGWYVPDRFELPGGELISPYLDSLMSKLQAACQVAMASVQNVTLTYAAAVCTLATNRDYWDADNQLYACGYNPSGSADDTVMVVRVTNELDEIKAVIVNYSCHPTTLAWDNTLLSPDYVGAMRAVVEKEIDGLCIFTLGACGDQGPRHGFVGDTAIADRNGRQLGYAALSALESMEPPGTDFVYQGPVISGATVGTWAAVPFDNVRRKETTVFKGGCYSIDLPLIDRPDAAELEREMTSLMDEVAAADARRDLIAARDLSAHAERARRWLARLKDLPEGETFALNYSVYRIGDAIWVTCGGEPYTEIQIDLRKRFSQHILLFSPLASDLQVAYLLPREKYGQGLYQEEPSILAPGCLEALTEAIAMRIEALI